MKAGDNVKIITKDETLEGVMMPEEEGFYFLKLENGYNIGISKRNVKEVILKGKKEEKEEKEKKTTKKKDLPIISILHTGGTIASKVDYETGGVSAKFKPEQILEMFPEIKNIANIESRLIANIMSENMNFENYNLLAQEIEKEAKKKIKGIIITHGTDTMHYTSAALSFMLGNINMPVILVGAQRSSDRGSSDAYSNLVAACVYIANTDDTGVRICMHKNENDDINLIINGLKARKMHTSRRDAFKPINELPIAEVDYEKKSIKVIRKPEKIQRKEGILYFKDVKIGMIKVRPGMKSEEFLHHKDYDGIIIEGTGLGHAPIEDSEENEKIRKAIGLLCKNCVVAMAPETIYGRINIDVYRGGRILQEMGVLGNNLDMTPETAYIKLAWLLSNHKKEEAKKLYSENIAGEISKRSENIFI